MKGSLGKAPAIQWYYKDWLSDRRLQLATASTRGIWMNILMFMIDCSLDGDGCEAGMLESMSTRRLASLGGCTEDEAEQFIEEALELKFCDISVTGDGLVTLMSRRLSRDAKIRADARGRKRKQREKEAESEKSRESHGLVPPVSQDTPSPTPSPNNKYTASNDAVGADGVDYLTTKKGRKLNGKKFQMFNVFWDSFGYKKGKREAADAWNEIPQLTDGLINQIIEAAKKEADRRPGLIADGKTPKMAQGWISGRRWEDEEYVPKEPDPLPRNREAVC